MPALSKKDMGNTAKSGPYASRTRPEIFQLKIKDKKPFILGKQQTGKKVTGVSFDENALVLYWTNSQKKTGVAKITEVFKDGDFGGGTSGSGGGDKLTEIVECLQCYYSAYIFNSSISILSSKFMSLAKTLIALFFSMIPQFILSCKS